jgi:hypothetical protein
MRMAGKVAEPGKEEWLPLSIRSFICSHGSTLSVIWAPAISHAGRPATKLSSITH